ncbi:hypothetical protein BRAS3843_330053 [Bradyrhizobium sp. STM 3843]|nr:hypothetical protein BRAS3843_330053 [Bradyrhizobium sp. STM 3843]
MISVRTSSRVPGSSASWTVSPAPDITGLGSLPNLRSWANARRAIPPVALGILPKLLGVTGCMSPNRSNQGYDAKSQNHWLAITRFSL